MNMIQQLLLQKMVLLMLALLLLLILHNVTAAGVHQSLFSGGTAGNHGFKTFTLTGTINGDGPGPWAPTNSINWSNADYDGAAITQGGNKGFDFSTQSHFVDESSGTGGPAIYGAAYSPEAAYIFANEAQTNATGTFDWRFSKK